MTSLRRSPVAATTVVLLALGAATAFGQAAPSAGDSGARAKPAPFAFADFTWINGAGREHSPPLDTKYFTPEFRFDGNFIDDFAHPRDHTLDGAAESGRTGEIQVQQLGIGGDFHYEHVRGRLMTQFGAYSTGTPRNDASTARGQGDLANAYRYVSEAYGGYHWDALNGINLDAGIFMSYVGLFSYYNADNWAYQPSYVSANTPWFFNGLRLQTFPSQYVKVEFWMINGWQSYGMFNGQPGWGTQVLWRPNGAISLLTNDYYGYDTFGAPTRMRIHSDNSFLLKYYENKSRFFDRAAFSITGDIGCESGGGVRCMNGNALRPDQYFLGFMLYDRAWFAHDRYGLTIGGGAIDNPGRYLVVLPQINGASAASGTPYFSTSPGTQYHAWDGSLTFDYMPDDYVTFRAEFDHREASVPYFAGRGGITPPNGNTGAPGSFVFGWRPDLRRAESRLNFALLVRL